MPEEQEQTPQEAIPPAAAGRPDRPGRGQADWASRYNVEGLGIPIQAQVDMEKRKISAYAATLNVVDDNDRMLRSGAFNKSIQERLPRQLIKLFVEHITNVGYATHLEEDSTGLYSESYVTKTPQGDSCLTMCADGSFTHYSYYASATDWENVPEDPEDEAPDWSDMIMVVKSAILRHIGPVSDPANLGARILMVRSSVENLIESMGDVLPVIRAMLAPGAVLTRRDKTVANHLLRLTSDLRRAEPNLKALIEPAYGTPSKTTAPPLATESSAVVEPQLLASLASLVELRKRALL